jgi:hypothetical protein
MAPINYKIIRLPFIFYCCKTVTLREQNELGEFENRMLRGLLALKWEMHRNGATA